VAEAFFDAGGCYFGGKESGRLHEQRRTHKPLEGVLNCGLYLTDC